MPEEKTQSSQDCNWSWGYFVYRLAWDIARAEGKALNQMKRSEYLALLREIVSALGGAEKGSIEGSRFSR